MLVYKFEKEIPEQFRIVDEEKAISIIDSSVIIEREEFINRIKNDKYDEILFLSNTYIDTDTTHLDNAITFKYKDIWYCDISRIYDIVSNI